MLNLSSQAVKIVKDHLPQNDFLGQGVCFRERVAGTSIDTLIVHSCYVDERVIHPASGGMLSCDDTRVRELAHAWIEAKRKCAECVDESQREQLHSRASEAEFLALHALVVSRRGAAALHEFEIKAIKDIFEFYGVSAHFAISRDGEIFEFVAPELLAFHAGKSKMPRVADGREGVNAFSIGVELIGNERSGFTEGQYVALGGLTQLLRQRFPLTNFFGHSDIAPGRKTDPYDFDWKKFAQLVGLKKDAQYWSGALS